MVPSTLPEAASSSETHAKPDYYDVGDDDGDCEEKSPTIRFFPPAYIQRYNTVQEILSSERYHGKIRKIVEFGCAELNFVKYMKNMDMVEEIVCVDIDRPILDSNKGKTEPLYAEYLHERSCPLAVSVYEGSVTQSDDVLRNADAVVCIELIEHLYADTLDALPANIFGFMKPKVALMTTPNAEFNVLFTNMNGFRHYDHKFEWTRQEFQDWADNIVKRYPEYEVTFHGICPGPKGSEHLGCCSQMAVFHRLSEIDGSSRPQGVEGLYKLVVQQIYPYKIDSRSDEEKILDDARYYIRHYSTGDSDYNEEIPLALIKKSIKKFRVSEETLREVLEQDGWTIEQRDVGPVIVVPPFSLTTSNESLFGDEDAFLDEDSSRRRDAWDDEAGPPAHYSAEYLQDRYLNVPNNDTSENWDIDDDIDDTLISTCALNGSRVTPDESDFSRGESRVTQYPSICSMYLERSREGTMEECPLNSSSDSGNVATRTGPSSFSTNAEVGQPCFTSSPQIKRSRGRNREEEKKAEAKEKDQIRLATIVNGEVANERISSSSGKAVPKRLSLDEESLPNRFSPDIADSGYPPSAPDMSPDLPSSVDDIPDSDSPSVAEAPRPGFLEVLQVENGVENGDLANNNRDDEGNNVIAAEERRLDGDFQPLINVLEIDMENEND